jgi:RNA polymerase sigma-70 factor (ECF subfamily)
MRDGPGCNWVDLASVIQFDNHRGTDRREITLITDDAAHGDVAMDRPSLRSSDSILAHDRATFDGMIAPLIEPAYRLAYAILRQREAAEDVVQEATFKAWRRMPQFRGEGGGFRAWYFTIVAHECRSLQRGRWWSVVRFGDLRRMPAPIDAGLNASELRQLIAQLAYWDRVLLYLFYWLDLPLEEVAGVLGISPAAAKARLYRAVGRLRLQLDPDQETM